MAKGLTEKQKDILIFISNYIDKITYPPTIREIADNFGISIRGCYDHIKALEKKEYISCKENTSRSIKIMKNIDGSAIENEKSIDNIFIPILGNVRAGVPILSDANYEGNINIPKTMFGDDDFFALRVRGDSMINAGILPGDLAVIKSQKEFKDGEIIVVETEKDLTIKRAYTERNSLRLEPANVKYPAIIVEDARVLGKLVGIIRNY